MGHFRDVRMFEKKFPGNSLCRRSPTSSPSSLSLDLPIQLCTQPEWGRCRCRGNTVIIISVPILRHHHHFFTSTAAAAISLILPARWRCRRCWRLADKLCTVNWRAVTSSSCRCADWLAGRAGARETDTEGVRVIDLTRLRLRHALFCLVNRPHTVARLPSGWRAGLRRRRAWVQIAAASPSGNSLRQTVHTHRASVHRQRKLVTAVLTVARVTAGMAESNGSLPPGLWLTSPAGWLQRSSIDYLYLFL